MFILASASPRRKELLHKLTDDFVVIPSHCDERLLDGLPKEILAAELSRLKAYELKALHPDDEVLAADTIVLLGDEVLGKPKDEEDAVRMLLKEQGKHQIVITGYCYLGKGREVNRSVATEVFFRDMSEEEIRAYVQKEKPLDKAGAYGIQDEGTPVREIVGSYDNVMGLPTEDLARHVFGK